MSRFIPPRIPEAALDETQTKDEEERTSPIYLSCRAAYRTNALNLRLSACNRALAEESACFGRRNGRTAEGGGGDHRNIDAFDCS